MADEPKIDLSIYLAKEGAGNPDENIKNPGSLNKAALNLQNNCQATLYIRRQHSNPPKWATFFQDFVDASDFGRNSSTGAVLSIPWQQRTFLVAFGQGWHNIDSARIETEFGLRTALNILDPTSIRSIDKSTLEAQPTHLREQSGRATEVQYFGIDVEFGVRVITPIYKVVTLTPNSFVYACRYTIRLCRTFLDKACCFSVTGT